MKIPLRAGRFFNDSADAGTAPQHVVVNEAWVKQYVQSQDPIGKRIKFTYSPKENFREIVGVVGNTADTALDSPDEPTLFLPFSQDANSFINYIVRTGGKPTDTLSAVRSSLRAMDPQLVLIQPFTMDQIISQSPSWAPNPSRRWSLANRLGFVLERD